MNVNHTGLTFSDLSSDFAVADNNGLGCISPSEVGLALILKHSVLATPREIHDHYDYTGCTTTGTVLRNSAEAGAPYITGYKPGRNYQRSLLPDAINARLESDHSLSALMDSDVEVVPSVPSVDSFANILVDPPGPAPPLRTDLAERPAFYARQRVDYLEREAANQRLGAAGEQYALNLERARLILAGKEHLSDRVEHTSIVEGDGAGFDIRSFEENGRDRFIEVKTTKYGAETPFYVTANELRFSVVNAGNYHLYRLFGFRTAPKLFTLTGNIADRADLTLRVYLARDIRDIDRASNFSIPLKCTESGQSFLLTPL